MLLLRGVGGFSPQKCRFSSEQHNINMQFEVLRLGGLLQAMLSCSSSYGQAKEPSALPGSHVRAISRTLLDIAGGPANANKVQSVSSALCRCWSIVGITARKR